MSTRRRDRGVLWQGCRCADLQDICSCTSIVRCANDGRSSEVESVRRSLARASFAPATSIDLHLQSSISQAQKQALELSVGHAADPQFTRDHNMTGDFTKARSLIYAAHDEDPNKHTTADGKEVPYETHYSLKMEKYLEQRSPNASDVLKLAIYGQHFRRWEVPRDSYPMTKLGYHSWRTFLKKRQGELVGAILEESGYSTEDQQRCEALIKKDGLRQGEEEVQVLEDVACLVFLDDQFDEFKEKHDEQKIIDILRKTWVKMSKEGQDLALKIPMTSECQELVGKALAA